MKKAITCITTAALAVSMSISAFAAEPANQDADLVYGTATLTYQEFYSGDVSSEESYDAVSSATNSKYNIFANTYTDFVDEDTNAEGYHVLGVANVNVAVPASDVEAYKAINPTFVESETIPAQYKTVTVTGDTASYSATEFAIADTVTDAGIEVMTDSVWGDYQINILENSTGYIRNTREDEGFAIASNIEGIIVETASGLKVGMEHLQSIWIQPYEISWNVSVDNSHNTHIAAYDNIAELNKLMGETVTKVTFINQDDAYVYEFEGAYLPIKFEGSLSVENAASADGTTAVSVEGLPEDYEPVYTVEGLETEVSDNSLLTWSEDLPGAYTLKVEDAGGVYALMSADFVLSTALMPAAYDADAKALVTADGADEAMFDAFIRNISTVTVNGTEYSASGRGAVVIINTLGELDTEASVTEGRGEDAVTTPIFGEAGTYEITVSSTGFDNSLTFTVEMN